MYSMKKGGSAKSRKQQAAIAISMKAAGKKPKMQMGGQNGSSDGKVTQEWYNPRAKDNTTRMTVVADTSGYSTGAKKFPTTTTTARGKYSGTASRKKVEDMIKNPKRPSYGVYKKGGSVGKSKMQMGGIAVNKSPKTQDTLSKFKGGIKKLNPGEMIEKGPYRPGDYPKPKNPKDMLERGPYRPSNKSINPRDIIEPLRKAKTGGSLKPVDKSKNPGLAKLPTPVRNKMGYQKYGGSTKMKKGGMVGKSKKC